MSDHVHVHLSRYRRRQRTPASGLSSRERHAYRRIEVSNLRAPPPMLAAGVQTLKLSAKQVTQILRDFGNDRTGPFILRGCHCLGCQVLRGVLDSVRRTVESR